MASYLELYDIAQNNSDMQDRVRVACIVAADAIRGEQSPPPNQDARELWAARAMENPKYEAERMLWAVLAANKDATRAQIEAADDSTLQTAVDAAVDLFADNPAT